MHVCLKASMTSVPDFISKLIVQLLFMVFLLLMTTVPPIGEVSRLRQS